MVERWCCAALAAGFCLLAHGADYGRLGDRLDGAAPSAWDRERILARQDVLLARALNGLQGSRAGVPDLYFIGFAGFGHQAVFGKEVLFAHRLFARGLGAERRALMLINHPSLAGQVPLATLDNLRRALLGVAARMDPVEDILVLFLTSHGSPDHVLEVRLADLRLEGITVAALSEALADSGIQWKVVVISACYSGGFIDRLAGPRSLIITAARRDRASFGCTDDAELTYFGRAFLAEAAARNDDFVAAFHEARRLVGRWEEARGHRPSLPQIHAGAAIEARLAAWRRAREAP